MLHHTLLEALPYDDLRAIANRLKLRKGHGQRSRWLTDIYALWQAHDSASATLSQLSESALYALWRLHKSQRLPALLFFKTFGSIRRPGAKLNKTTKRTDTPWKLPRSPAEELYYHGLLFAEANYTIDHADWVLLPSDLHQLLEAWFQLHGSRWQAQVSTESPAQTHLPSLPLSNLSLLHDLAHILAFIYAENVHKQVIAPSPTLRQARYLTKRLALPHLPIATLKQTEQSILQWVRFLTWLATKSGLLAAGQPQAWMWQWLEMAPADQLRSLWNHWLPTVEMGAMDAFQPMDAVLHLPADWQRSFPNEPGTLFSPQDLTHGYFTQTERTLGPLLAWFDSVDAIDEQFAHLLAGALLRWGVVEKIEERVVPFYRPLDVDTALPTALYVSAPRYRLSEIGRWLFFPETTDTPSWRWQKGAGQWQFQPAAKIDESLAGCVLRSWDGEPAHLVRLAPFIADYHWREDKTAQAPVGHLLRLDHSAIVQASSAGVSATQLWEVVQRSQFPLPIGDWPRLLQWFDEANVVKLSLVPILRTQSAEQMIQLQTTPALYAFFDELFTPTIASWRGDKTSLLAQLARLDLYPRTPVSAAPNLQSPISNLQLDVADAGTLWLALKLYGWIGKFAVLPAPVSSHLSNQLLAALSEEEQSALQQQLRQIKSTLEDAIDQLPHTPPTHPSDPAQWRPLINQAIDANAELELLHFSAGRNLTVQRRVTPHYVDDKRFGGPALRGWCHSSGRDLWFRLDRIQTLTIVTIVTTELD